MNTTEVKKIKQSKKVRSHQESIISVLINIAYAMLARTRLLKMLPTLYISPYCSDNLH